ncbi:transposase-like protein [Pseudomonas psychrotolerans]|uniref:Transposase-like protein n=1 Tax=Pseudomonas oryzihabitans TaxID=47885 RepID=A0AAJ2EYC3_9PSED|nr:transposase-like protein [Pseudomonas psychrotolerans]MDR6357864.1 transposase-like protein [Pseudomonas psychrotolerans]
MELREEFVGLAQQTGANVRLLCRRFGISPTTGYKWLARARAGEALTDRSRRPATSPGRCAPEQASTARSRPKSCKARRGQSWTRRSGHSTTGDSATMPSGRIRRWACRCPRRAISPAPAPIAPRHLRRSMLKAVSSARCATWDSSTGGARSGAWARPSSRARADPFRRDGRPVRRALAHLSHRVPECTRPDGHDGTLRRLIPVHHVLEQVSTMSPGHTIRERVGVRASRLRRSPPAPRSAAPPRWARSARGIPNSRHRSGGNAACTAARRSPVHHRGGRRCRGR